MITTLPHQLQSLFESICETGCEHVNGIIDTLDQQLTTEEVSHLDEQEKTVVLNALKNIMSVYDD